MIIVERSGVTVTTADTVADRGGTDHRSHAPARCGADDLFVVPHPAASSWRDRLPGVPCAEGEGSAAPAQADPAAVAHDDLAGDDVGGGRPVDRHVDRRRRGEGAAMNAAHEYSARVVLAWLRDRRQR